VAGLNDRRIKYLSKTHEGKKHDKKIGDEEGITVPVGSDLYRDSGFQGHEMPGVNIHQPKKKPRGGELSVVDKVQNRLVSSVRVVVEHVITGVKRCRIVKDIFRNTTEGYDDRSRLSPYYMYSPWRGVASGERFGYLTAPMSWLSCS
jgi:hypothetical protein